MGSVEWNKKEELVAEQALKHLKVCLFVCVLAIIILAIVMVFITVVTGMKVPRTTEVTQY